MGVMNSGREALIVQYSYINYIGHNRELEDTVGVDLIQPRNSAKQEHS